MIRALRRALRGTVDRRDLDDLTEPVLLAVAADRRVLGWWPAGVWQLVQTGDGWRFRPLSGAMHGDVCPSDVAEIVLYDPQSRLVAAVIEPAMANAPMRVMHSEAVTRLEASARAPFAAERIPLTWA